MILLIEQISSLMNDKEKKKPKRFSKGYFLSEIDSIDDSSTCSKNQISKMKNFQKKLRQFRKKNPYLTDEQIQSKDQHQTIMIHESQYEADQQMVFSDLESHQQFQIQHIQDLKRKRQQMSSSDKQFCKIRKGKLNNIGIIVFKENQSASCKGEKSQLSEIEGFNSSIENQQSQIKKQNHLWKE